jgi:hypothetical protein
MVAMRKIDGTYSITMWWNVVIILLTGVFGVAVAMLPELEKVVPPEGYVVIAMVIKGIDVALRQITYLPMDRGQ